MQEIFVDFFGIVCDIAGMRKKKLELLSVRSFAARTDYKASTVWRKIERGEIQCVRMGPTGRTIRIPVTEIDRLIISAEGK